MLRSPGCKCIESVRESVQKLDVQKPFLCPRVFLAVMQLAIDEDRRVQEPDEGLEMKTRAGGAQRGRDDWARRYHQWQSHINQGSTQVNSTGVYWAMYWAIYTVQGRARTKLS